MRSTSNQWAVAAGLLLATGLGQASELVYSPTNPSFGGNPMYGSYLLGSAQATSKHEDKGGQESGSPFASCRIPGDHKVSCGTDAGEIGATLSWLA